MLLSIGLAYLICLVSGLTTSTTAYPISRFSHHVRSLKSENIHRTPRLESRTSRLLHHLSPRSTRLQRRGLPGAVYICTDQNFRGDCSWIAPNKQCHIPGTGEFGPESIGPDPGGFCILWSTATCSGNQIETLRFPGRATGMPAFMGLKCYADGEGSAGNTTIVQNGSAVGSGILSDADPRLAGGFGSMEAKQLKKQLDQMEEDGFRQGMIGLRKGHYY
ncbi:hypothetical protein K458DRAFT_354131 [Lentithecium fluviatile CBS 122367]|uniref:Uncharacterized protein n=1 Tax=Lentithecium fluviatile CBS 122367 TaxID=1168545 RepID=A0A6G1JNG4_9PLEO|nr:hypothetical protein K458DRAFT_354131 [Lentithecium fluviatile CBS 122367]